VLLPSLSFLQYLPLHSKLIDESNFLSAGLLDIVKSASHSAKICAYCFGNALKKE